MAGGAGQPYLRAMTDAPLPAFLLSHGAPTLPLEDSPARDFLVALGRGLPRPRAILVVSAHWGTAAPTVDAPPFNDTIHDLRGMPTALGAGSDAPRAERLHASTIFGVLRMDAYGVRGAADSLERIAA